MVKVGDLARVIAPGAPVIRARNIALGALRVETQHRVGVGQRPLPQLAAQALRGARGQGFVSARLQAHRLVEIGVGAVEFSLGGERTAARGQRIGPFRSAQHAGIYGAVTGGEHGIRTVGLACAGEGFRRLARGQQTGHLRRRGPGGGHLRGNRSRKGQARQAGRPCARPLAANPRAQAFAARAPQGVAKFPVAQKWKHGVDGQALPPDVPRNNDRHRRPSAPFEAYPMCTAWYTEKPPRGRGGKAARKANRKPDSQSDQDFRGAACRITAAPAKLARRLALY